MKERVRQYDREDNTYEEIKYILSKSDSKCCHCGCLLKVGFNFSRDHYIPLNKGGTNELENLYGLCKECNQKKTDYIMHPYDYYNYLKEDYMEELLGIYTGYIEKVRWTSLNNFTKDDVKVFEEEYKYSTRKNAPKVMLKYILKKVNLDEIDNLVDFLVQYNKKYLDNDDIVGAKDTLENCVTNGSLYRLYRNDETIAIFSVGITTEVQDNVTYYVLSMPGFVCNYQKEQYKNVLRRCLYYILRGLAVLTNDKTVVWTLDLPRTDTYALNVINPFVSCIYTNVSEQEYDIVKWRGYLIETDFNLVKKSIYGEHVKFKETPALELLKKSNRLLVSKFKLKDINKQVEQKRKEKQKNRLRKETDKEMDIRNYM